MATSRKKSAQATTTPTTKAVAKKAPPRQVVLVLQGGGALGAYQVGVYEALHEAGIEPDWIIGTSIGAINAALIAGNPREHRQERLDNFWHRLEKSPACDTARSLLGANNMVANLDTMLQGVPAFFSPRSTAYLNPMMPVGIEQASYYDTNALAHTLRELVDFGHLNTTHTRLTVGTVNARTGQMHYFDTRAETLNEKHILASGAFPPAFPAVRIDGEPYWDGGIYSNTPIEAVFDDTPRRDSIIFSVQLWRHQGPEPTSIWQVMGRQKDIQFSSRARSHLARQKQIHHLRHIIRELTQHLPENDKKQEKIRELAAWGCGTTMHVVKLNLQEIPGEDHTKDIDFTPSGIAQRRHAGYEDTLRMLTRKPWETEYNSIEGVMIYEAREEERTT